jgi:hypothetical protein
MDPAPIWPPLIRVLVELPTATLGGRKTLANLSYLYSAGAAPATKTAGLSRRLW